MDADGYTSERHAQSLRTPNLMGYFFALVRKRFSWYKIHVKLTVSLSIHDNSSTTITVSEALFGNAIGASPFSYQRSVSCERIRLRGECGSSRKKRCKADNSHHYRD
jgi:hypothetical protein